MNLMKFSDFLLTESINDRGILKAIFVVGIPGAGKSYTIKKISGDISPLIVNTDKAVEYLVKKTGVEATDDTWSMFEDSSKRITRAQLQQYVNGMLPLFVDGTSNDVSNILNRVGILESLGYDVGCIFVNTSIEVAKARAEERAKKIGRHVNMEFIERTHKLAEENKQFLKGKMDFFKEFNNDGDEMTNAVLDKLFTQVRGFFDSPLKNPVGRRQLEKLKAEGEKYLSPTIMDMDVISRKINSWYKAK